MSSANAATNSSRLQLTVVPFLRENTQTVTSLVLGKPRTTIIPFPSFVASLVSIRSRISFADGLKFCLASIKTIIRH